MLWLLVQERGTQRPRDWVETAAEWKSSVRLTSSCRRNIDVLSVSVRIRVFLYILKDTRETLVKRTERNRPMQLQWTPRWRHDRGDTGKSTTEDEVEHPTHGYMLVSDDNNDLLEDGLTMTCNYTKVTTDLPLTTSLVNPGFILDRASATALSVVQVRGTDCLPACILSTLDANRTARGSYVRSL